MKEPVTRFLVSSAGLVPIATTLAFLLISAPADAKTTEVKCDKGDTIQEIFDGGKVEPGDTILVNGTCEENLIVGSEHARITIDGQGTATIAPTSGFFGILIRGTPIIFKDITIANGDSVNRGVIVQTGYGFFNNATIKGFTERGVDARESGYAVVWKSEVLNNGKHGVSAAQNSETRVQHSLIKNNGGSGFGNGIWVKENSGAQITFNEILNNSWNGVLLQDNADADVLENNISGNGRSGVRVQQLSTVHLRFGQHQANGTDPANPNEQFGVSCDSGQVNGDLTKEPFDSSLDSLHGESGSAELSPDCIDRLTTE